MKKNIILLSGAIFLSFLIVIPFQVKAQEIVPDRIEIVRARVLDVQDQGTTNIPELNIPQINQQITAEIYFIDHTQRIYDNMSRKWAEMCYRDED